MILESVLAAALLVPVSLDRVEPSHAFAPTMSPGRKAAVVRPLIRSATECIARTVSKDPRMASASGAGFNDLLVDSMSSCVTPLRAMIDAYDDLFGDGAGEKFFLGPYLDALPEAVSTRIKDAR